MELRTGINFLELYHLVAHGNKIWNQKTNPLKLDYTKKEPVRNVGYPIQNRWPPIPLRPDLSRAAHWSINSFHHARSKRYLRFNPLHLIRIQRTTCFLLP